ncbi:MAG: hypothetical protein ACRDIB_20475 [Ardenticatenaceae bacterium]
MIRLSRRQFVVALAALSSTSLGELRLVSVVGAQAPPIIPCDAGPTANGSFLFDRDNWKRHGIAHLVNLLWPGDHGSVAFEGDISPFDARLPQVAPGDDPPDVSAGAYSACAIEAFFDPYYTFESQGGNLALVMVLDAHSQELECGPTRHFHRAGWAQQIQVNHEIESTPLGLLREAWDGAWLLTMAMILGAAHNYRVTNDIGWPGPSNHYFHGTPEGSHTGDDWLRPATATSDGNLP